MKNEIQGITSRLGNPWKEVEQPTQKTPKAKQRYVKSPELREFENEYNAHKYDNSCMPEYARIRTHFRDDTANALTAAIIAHLEYYGHFAARVNTTGVYDARRGKYRTTNARKGMADISALIKGRAVQIEVKAGHDRPRVEQLQVQKEYEAAGGKYLFIHTFAEWVQEYGKL